MIPATRPQEVTMAATTKAGSADLAELRRQQKNRQAGNHPYAALLGLRAYDPLSLDARVRRGLAYAALERFLHNTALTTRQVAEVIQTPTRTLARRKEAGHLAPEESDRLLRASRVAAGAIALFEGDVDAARHWLLTPQPLLGGRTPWELAATDIGAREVEHLVGRLEHGIPS
jgi:putative toxin-antitoxin system antitoxin component (TIGR02293 family)